MHIAGRGRKGFVTGNTEEPAENSAGYETWETGNAIVKGWLINSMEPAIMGFFIHLRTAKEVWEEVARTYYDGSDISQIYELKVQSFRLRQEGRPVGVYYADLKSVWQELDQRRPIKMACAVDLKTIRDEIQIDRVYAFLAGLDDLFDKVRSDILHTQPLPSVEEVFSVVRREAQRHATMMSGSNNQGGLPSMAMVSRPAAAFHPSNPSSQSLNSRPFTRENKDDLKCTFCGQTRHTEDTCFAKHGVPDWFPELKKKLRAKERGSGGNNGGRASLATAPPKAKEDQTISNNPSQTLLTRSTHGDSSSTIGGDVTIEQRVESGTKPLLGESRQATIEMNLAVEQPCAEPSIPFIEEPNTSSLSSSEVPPNTSSLSSSEVPPNTSSLNMPEIFTCESLTFPFGMKSSGLWKESETQSSNDYAYGQRQPFSDPYGDMLTITCKTILGIYHLMTTLHNTLTLHRDDEDSAKFETHRNSM
ncbi:hypothetical protein L3X38_003933 [Prunus dulcis]|uniref:Retrotransposon gag domain-containing protein n=1 Tax=Prunus dulcis TaxID=3755 RepID=A0AAD4ZN13_PRUDU|nr:hypothetical protein L3X38_003933 [Prunus dulcis]